VRLNDSTGVAIPTVSNENKIDLTRAVLTLLFLDFIKVVKNWFNYDLNVIGKLAIMNLLKKKSIINILRIWFTEVKKTL
jgi:hypothetical protein